MMQLLCDGVRLDLYENAGLQFTHDNPLFAFDNLKCERTTQFKLPSTPINDRVFALARIPAYAGAGMRRRFDAQLQASAVTKDGYLYIASFDGKDYNAVFVTGDLVGLQAVKNAGKVREFLVYNNAVTWGSPKDANAQGVNDYDIVRYAVSDGAVVCPSARIKRIVDDAMSQLGASIDWSNATNYGSLRIFNANKISLNDTEVHFRNVPDQTQDPINLQDWLGITQYQLSGAYMYYDCNAVRDESGYFWAAQRQSISHFDMIKFPIDITIEFPADFPSNYFLVTDFTAWYYDSMRGYYDEPSNMPITFLGGWAFRWDGSGWGDPLAGRKIAIPANTPFCLITPDGIVYESPSSGAHADYIGFDPSLVPAYDFVVKVSTDHEFTSGENTPYNAILPDMTLVELLQAVAAATGNMLNYENGTIKFEPLSFNTWPVKYIDAIVKKGEVKRTFADYAQRNNMQYDSGASVRGSEKITAVYNIDNVNIESDKDLQTLKCSEGGYDLSSVTSGDDTYIQERVKIRGTDDSKSTIAYRNALNTYMLRVAILKNAGLQALCDASTQFVVTARMSLYDYEQITAKTLLQIEGTRYVWTSRSWQKNEAQFTLAKVP